MELIDSWLKHSIKKVSVYGLGTGPMIMHAVKKKVNNC